MSASPFAVPFLAPADAAPRPVPSWTKPREGWRRPGAALARLRGSIGAAWRRIRSRRALARLDAALLKDIGVSFAEAEQEANKPFWVA